MLNESFRWELGLHPRPVTGVSTIACTDLMREEGQSCHSHRVKVGLTGRMLPEGSQHGERPQSRGQHSRGSPEDLLFYRCPAGALGIKWEKVERAGL